MNRIVTRAIILTRTNYQEADRILTLLTPDHGKLHVLAKGVRKSKSKMAGGIELFSISEIGYLQGKGELGTLTSSRLLKHFKTIVQDIDRTMLGYELIKLLNKLTEDAAESAYFDLLSDSLEALDDSAINKDLIRLWFSAQLLKIAGHTPNLQTDKTGKALNPAGKYLFDYDAMSFSENSNGTFRANHIKFLRLVFGNSKPNALQKISDTEKLIKPSLQLVQTIRPAHLTI